MPNQHEVSSNSPHPKASAQLRLSTSPTGGEVRFAEKFSNLKPLPLWERSSAASACVRGYIKTLILSRVAPHLSKFCRYHLISFIMATCFMATASCEQNKTDRQWLLELQSYLNSLKHVTARFVQTTPQGHTSTGQFFLSKPHKLKWEYQTPKQISILMKGTNITYYDKGLDQISDYQAPPFFSKILTTSNINLFKLAPEYSVKALHTSGLGLDLYINQDTPQGSTTFIMRFSKDPIELLGLVLSDGTRIQFSSLINYGSLDGKLFKL